MRVPIASTDVAFCHSFVRHYIEKTRSYFFTSNRLMDARNHNALTVYDVYAPDVLLRYCTQDKRRIPR